MSRLPLTVCCLIVVLSSAAPGQCPGTGEPWHTDFSAHSESDALSSQATWEAICTELTESATNDWPGFYVASVGDTGELQFRWAPKSGFAAVWTGCFPGVNDTYYGGIDRTADGLRLVPRSAAPRSRGRRGLPERLVFVRWGDRRYLVSHDSMGDFCEFTAGIIPYEPELPRPYLCHVDDLEKPVADVPIVPAAYRSLLRKPIDARISRVGQPKREDVEEDDNYQDVVRRVRLNIGSAHGVRVGMRFSEHGQLSGFCWFAITAVSRHWSTAEMRSRVLRTEPDGECSCSHLIGSDISVGTVLTNRPVLPATAPN